MKTLEGWCSAEEMLWLSQAASRREIVIELGSHKGRSTAALCTADKVVAVDNWITFPDAYDSFVASYADEIESGKVVPMRLNLYGIETTARCDLVRQYAGQADMIFIDAAHGAWHVMSDISLARLLLKPCGLLCGHDLCDGWPGVREALDACAITYQREAGSIWREC